MPIFIRVPHGRAPFFDHLIARFTCFSLQYMRNSDCAALHGQRQRWPRFFVLRNLYVRLLHLFARVPFFQKQVKPDEAKSQRNRLGVFIGSLCGKRIHRMLVDKVNRIGMGECVEGEFVELI